MVRRTIPIVDSTPRHVNAPHLHDFVYPILARHKFRSSRRLLSIDRLPRPIGNRLAFSMLDRGWMAIIFASALPVVNAQWCACFRI